MSVVFKSALVTATAALVSTAEAQSFVRKYEVAPFRDRAPRVEQFLQATPSSSVNRDVPGEPVAAPAASDQAPSPDTKQERPSEAKREASAEGPPVPDRFKLDKVKQAQPNASDVRALTKRVNELARAINAERKTKSVQSGQIDMLQAELKEAQSSLEQATESMVGAREVAEQAEAVTVAVRNENKTLAAINKFLKDYSRYVTLGAILLVALGVSLAAMLVIRARRRSAALKDDLDHKIALDQKRKYAADWLLIGPSGRLKLRGSLLAEGERGSVIGRGQSDADVIVDDKSESVSRRHARFFYRNGNLLVEDLQSLNGTFVNDQRFNSGEIRQVREHDKIGIAKFNFTLQRA
jgi:hypothetical protein